MSAAIAITRLDLTAGELRAGAARSREAQAARRMLAIALVLEGVDRKSAAETCGMDRQTLRDWVHRYKRRGSPGSRTAGAKRDRGGSTRAMWPNLCHGWRPAPTRWWTGWCAGGGRTFAPGSRTGSGWSCTSGRWASISRRSATGGCRCARGIRRPTLRPRNALKKLPRGGSRRDPGGGPRQAAGDLVPGRGPGRPAGHAHPGLGEAGHTARGAARHPLTVGLHVRRGLPRARHRGGSGHALRRHRRHERPSRRDRAAVAPGAHAVLVLDGAGWHGGHAPPSRTTSPSSCSRPTARN